MPTDRNAWETSAEVEFISKLGTHSEHKLDREVLLEDYLLAMRLRKNWGKISQDEARERCLEELEKV